MNIDQNIAKAAGIIKESKHCTAFTGAGISVESGIPPFRGPEGIWSKYDPTVLEIDYFRQQPKESWEAIRDIFYQHFHKAAPNSAHIALAKLEKAGFIKAIITQNIDNLHQEAGSKTVWEYHGNYKRLICMKCGDYSEADPAVLEKIPPLCKKDQSVLKPDFIFFGEAIPEKANTASYHEAMVADVFILVGTTGEVMPANLIPRMARQNGATIIEINPEPSAYTYEVSDIFLKGRAGEVLPVLVEEVTGNR
ncbi:MAG: SIR2 family NAD-dependent protein deacylase [Bacteroidota bacterium]